MATVEPGYGAYLKGAARYVTTNIAGASDRWGDRALTTTVMSPLVAKADAQAMATYQAQFMAGPLARDTILVAGLLANLVGSVVRVFGDRLGYENGADVFVLGVREADKGGTSTLTVLKRL